MEMVFDFIAEIVRDHGCIKGTELVTEIVVFMYENKISGDATELMYEAAKQKHIIEIEYDVPMKGRTKSLFFPTGTKFRDGTY